MAYRIRLVLALMAAAAFVGCGDHGNNNDGGGGSGGSGGGTTSLKPTIGLDLSHIVGFAISGGPPVRPAWPDQAMDGGVTSSASTLYAIDDQGNLVVTHVTTFSGDGSFDGGTFDLSTVTTFAQEKPAAVHDTPKYVLFGFFGLRVSVNGDGGYVDTDCSGVIMRKSDGALFCYASGLNSAGFDDLSTDRVESNGGDLLFVEDGGMSRVDMSAATPQATKIVDSGVSDYTVNTDGDALASLTDNTAKALRVIKANGGLQNLLADKAIIQWLGPSGHDFYYVTYDQNSMPIWHVSLATRQSDGSYVVSDQGMFSQPSQGLTLALATANNAYGTLGNSNLIMELLGANQGMTHAVSALNGIVAALGVGSSIFVQGTDAAGNGGIVRVDVPAFTQTTILAPGDFTVSAISVSKTGELTFAGLRNSDGSHIVGNVAAGASTYTILSATAPMVTTLTRIN